MMDARTVQWQFWLLWVMASTLGGAAVALVARAAAYAVGYTVGDAGGTVLGEAALGVVALGGFMAAIAAAQWLVMMRQVAWAGRWLLANAAGGAITGAIMLSLMAALRPVAGDGIAALVGILLGLTAFGMILWMVVRRHVSWAVRLALAGVAGLVLAAVLGAGMIGALIGNEVGSGAGFAGVYGAVTGGALVFWGSSDLSSTSTAP